MYEKAKLAEAKYFYSQMSANFNDREVFTFNLSAFLSSARSVLQYALEEVKTKSGGQAWYDRQIAESPILQFFKGKRDVNIHTEPIKPTKHVNITLTERIGIRDSVSVIVRDAKGNIISQSSSETHQETKPPSGQQTSSTEVRWKFSDWAGSEDIMTLCQKYIDSLELFVKDGLDKGFLTG